MQHDKHDPDAITFTFEEIIRIASALSEARLALRTNDPALHVHADASLSEASDIIDVVTHTVATH